MKEIKSILSFLNNKNLIEKDDLDNLIEHF